MIRLTPEQHAERRERAARDNASLQHDGGMHQRKLLYGCSCPRDPGSEPHLCDERKTNDTLSEGADR